MKICKDCKHHVLKPGTTLLGYSTGHLWWKRDEYTTLPPTHVCTAPLIDRVTGENYYVNSSESCSWRRNTITDDCGPEGKLWEAKE